MARLRRRRSLLFLALGLVLVAAFVPGAAAEIAAVIFTALWVLLPSIAITRIRREASTCNEQPVSLFSLVASRAPPSRLTFA